MGTVNTFYPVHWSRMKMAFWSGSLTEFLVTADLHLGSRKVRMYVD